MTERREPVIQYMGPSMNRCMREILAFRIAQKKVHTLHTYHTQPVKSPALSNEHLSLGVVLCESDPVPRHLGHVPLHVWLRTRYAFT